MKHIFIAFLGFAIVLITFTSCFCPLIEFANKDCIAIIKQPYSILDMDAELCYFGSYKKEWIFYQYIVLDGITTLNSQQVQVNYRGKSLDFKMYSAGNEGWKETETIEITDSTVLRISIRDYIKEGDSLIIIEKDLPTAGDSIVTSIRIPTIYHQTQRFMSDSSKVFGFLKNRYDLYR